MKPCYSIIVAREPYRNSRIVASITFWLLLAQGGVAAGESHIMALRSDGTIVAWGDLGDNSLGQLNVPSSVQGQTIAVAAGFLHTVALRHDGSVVAWGAGVTNAMHYPHFGQSEVPLAAQTGVRAIAAGAHHTLVILDSPMRLNARNEGDLLILSWPTNATGVTLQSTTRVTPPFVCLHVTNPLVVIGARFSFTNTFSGSSLFYRLWRP